ncbi:Caleosin-domain-containing protein [Penicillium cinerascens]|uniref:Caleosin-domain-containing protein n=1 Tax=Penicillium cinerascens TaxID=70096 RepID=A0A9W9JEK9_9EURO|nr:Caleosin-domain-containing protein [Penicillium cinerascens]KAJ5195553.1 Caleosin-domain-containing protein [Penicillium cinerascens]
MASPIITSNSDLGFSTEASKAVVTQTRPLATNLGDSISKPAIARANAAVSRENPNGTFPARFQEYTPLQQHILFWDRDADGKISPYDTYIGFRELGFNILFSIIALLIINVNFSYPTRLAYSWFPDPFFRVYVSSVHKAKHGSDSGTYDNEGRFVPQAFENLFAKYDKKCDGTLTLTEIFNLMKGQRVAADPFGWGAAFFEWGTTWLLLQRSGKVYREDLRQLFDGSLFWRIRETRIKTGHWQQGFGIGGDGYLGSVHVS